MTFITAEPTTTLVTRILPCTEYARLSGTELDTVWPHLPERAQVLVVEDGDQIVGCWALYPLWHAEAIWISPAHRKVGRVARRLLQAMWDLARGVGAKTVITGAVDDSVRDLIGRLGGFKLPGDQYVLTVKE